MIGQSIGHYQVLEKLGEGGMGVVYKAQDTRLDRTVALKLLPEEMATDTDRRERFAREARAVAALSHPNIVTIFAVEEHEGAPFLAMEYIDGKSLEDLITDEGLPLKRYFELAIPIADALTAAHERRITHRDLKPANILVTEAGELKVLDFGLARVERPAESGIQEAPTATLTQAGHILGTVPYMSPEQVQGHTVDYRSDIFSFGVMLYEMATGRRPFLGDSSADLISAILRDSPASVSEMRRDLPRHLGRIIRHCIEKDPQRRYQTALDVGNELRDLKRELDSGELLAPERAIPRIVAEAKNKAYRSPLVGRDSERAELTRFLEQAETGHGALAMIGGEAGVGKTRLIDELIPEARERGFLTLVGHCYDTEGSRPVSAWAEILEHVARVAHRDTLRQLLGDSAPEVAKLLPELRRIFPDIPQPVALPPEQERHYLFTSFQEFIERSTQVQPILHVLEDLQWADELTLLLLQHMATHLDGVPTLLIGTYRDAELDASRPLGRLLPQLVRERMAHRLAIKRLSKEQVSEMLEGLSGQQPPFRLVDALFSTTEGNPFFVEEVYQHLEEEGQIFDPNGQWRQGLRIEELEVPEGVRLVVSRRLHRLSDDARRVLTSAAVVGRRFHFDLLEAVTDLDPESLVDVIEEAERLQLIKPVSGRAIRFDFAQELVRQTLMGSLSSLRRQRLHLRIADAMEETFAGDLENHASALANHLFEAGAAADPEKTVRFLMLAGRQALRAAAGEDALRVFQDAMSLLGPEDRKQRADLLFRRGWTLRSLGRWDEALEDWLEALPIYEELGATRAAARICRGIAVQLFWSSRFREASDVAQRGLRIIGEEASADRCRLLASAGLSHGGTGDYGAGMPLIEEALQMAEELGDESLMAEVVAYKAPCHWYFMEFRELLDAGERATTRLRSIGDLWQLSSSLGWCQWAHVFLGRPREAAEIGDELVPLAERVSHLGVLMYSTQCRALSGVMSSGDLDEFARRTQDAVDLALRVGGNMPASAETLLGMAQFWRGDWDQARQQFEHATQSESDTYNSMTNWGHLLLLESYTDEARAVELYEQLRGELPKPGEPNTRGSWTLLFAAVEGLSWIGRRDEIVPLYALTLQSLESGALFCWLGVGLLQTYAGMAAAAAQRWDEAEEHFRTAVGQADDLPHRIQQPEARRWYARMLLDRNREGDAGRARELLDEAIEGYRSLGMPKHLEITKKTRSQS